MACDFPRCECMCHPNNCVFLEKNRISNKKGNLMNEQVNKVAERPVSPKDIRHANGIKPDLGKDLPDEGEEAEEGEGTKNGDNDNGDDKAN